MNELDNNQPIDFCFIYDHAKYASKVLQNEDAIVEEGVGVKKIVPNLDSPKYLVWATCRKLENREVDFIIWSIYEQDKKKTIKIRGEMYYLLKENILNSFQYSQALKKAIYISVKEEIKKRKQ